MAKKETCVLTNMCMITDGDRVLVQDRADEGWPGIIFPGGHVEEGESIVDSVIREVSEETGLTVSDIRFCGIKQWTDEDDEGIIEHLFVFKCLNEAACGHIEVVHLIGIGAP